MSLDTGPEGSSAPPTEAASDSVAPQHLGIALLVIATTQLMVVLDGTIMNIALPSIQEDLDVSVANLSWVVNAYALAFGGLLLLGGRAGDLFGRRRVLRVGISVFTLASLLGGLSNSFEMLLAARVLQGVGAAIAAPTALSLIATTFPEGKPRNRAMGVYAAMAGVGSTTGMLLGGILTDVDWRWVLYINVPVGVAVLAGTRVLVDGARRQGRLDLPGAITGTTGLVSLVYAITRGGEDGWTDTLTVGAFALAVVLLVTFLVIQNRVANPMLPLRLLRDRSRAGAYVTTLCAAAGMFSAFYFMTLYTQRILGYSPLETGLSYLPFSIGMSLMAAVASKASAHVAPRLLAGPGLLLAAVGMYLFSTLDTDSSYVTHLMPAMFVTALGLGLTFLPMMLGAVRGVTQRDAGIASALFNTAHQIGGALGLAVLSTLCTLATDDRMEHANEAFFKGVKTHDSGLVHRASEALTHGYTTAFAVSAVLFLAGMVVALTVITMGKQKSDREQDPAAAA
ncbi:MFS transporter [Wenjunlia vitaminophila]|uniref:MFS transporter n=1 Tax=Wenjunlia vitaminophila TaxID=76728 RepID=A0A0T6LSK2_WENVI|nr:MFS transporter [Wenjunlia vitaminophila]KRV49127.1 MFS transporter [Wenjunlia vitaminophila]